MKKYLLIICLLFSAFANPAFAEENIAGKFIGTWKLISTTERLVDGSERVDSILGAHPQGYLMYSDKYMCAVLINTDRLKWTTENQPTADEALSAIKGLHAKCGIYEINAQESSVTHRIEVDKSPNAIGELQKRYFKFVDNRLYLKLAPPLPKGIGEISLIWERVD